MNRRSFLKVAGTALAVVAIPVKFLARKFHRLVGDGVTDDTEALQALVNGEKVQMPDGSFQQVGDGAAHLPTGAYKVRYLPGRTVLGSNNTSIIGAGVDKTRIDFVPSGKTRV